MTLQINISPAISLDYKHFGSPLYDLALANDLLAGYVLAGYSKSAMPALIQEFGSCSDYSYEEIEDVWNDHVYNIIEDIVDDEEFAHDLYEEKIAQDLAVFSSRISTLSEILNSKNKEKDYDHQRTANSY